MTRPRRSAFVVVCGIIATHCIAVPSPATHSIVHRAHRQDRSPRSERDARMHSPRGDQRLSQPRSRCAQWTDCATCAARISCNWCLTTSSCISVFDNSCASGLAPTPASCRPVASPTGCAAQTNCATCTARPECGWCSATHVCLHQNEQQQCSAGWAWHDFDCATSDCPTFRDCASCARNSGCSWCRANGRCVFVNQESTCGGAAVRFSADCNAPPAAGVCPPDMVFVTSGGNPRCECRAGLSWDAATRRCVRDTCTGGTMFDAARQTCVCPGAQLWSQRQRRCIASPCVGGTVFNSQNDRCDCPPSRPAWNVARRMCEPCAPGQQWDGTACGCPEGASLTGATCQCSGRRILVSGRCVCPAQTPVWDSGSSRCGACSGATAWDGARCVPVCEPPCQPGQSCTNGTCIGTGMLRVTMTWSLPGDMDLHVMTPGGAHIYYGNRNADGGRLDRDDTSGTGPENIFWTAAPPRGTYVICANPFSVRAPTTFTVEVRGAVQATHSGSRSREQRGDCAPGSPSFVAQFVVP